MQPSLELPPGVQVYNKHLAAQRHRRVPPDAAGAWGALRERSAMSYNTLAQSEELLRRAIPLSGVHASSSPHDVPSRVTEGGNYAVQRRAIPPAHATVERNLLARVRAEPFLLVPQGEQIVPVQIADNPLLSSLLSVALQIIQDDGPNRGRVVHASVVTSVTTLVDAIVARVTDGDALRLSIIEERPRFALAMGLELHRRLDLVAVDTAVPACAGSAVMHQPAAHRMPHLRTQLGLQTDPAWKKMICTESCHIQLYLGCRLVKACHADVLLELLYGRQ